MDFSRPTLKLSGFLRLSILLTLVLHLSSSAWALSGGRVASPQEFPATLRYQFKRDHIEPICTGVKISSRLILTAAHCFGDFAWSGWACGENMSDTMKVRNNQSHDKNLRISGVYIHPDVTNPEYHLLSTSYHHKWDLAVIEFEQDLPKNWPSAQLNFHSAPAGLSVWMGGFGQTSIEGMRYSDQLKISEASLHHSTNKKFEMFSPNDSFIYHGDSGGPVYDRQYLSVIGINSLVEAGNRTLRQVGNRDTWVITSYHSFATPLVGQRDWLKRILHKQIRLDCRP